MNKNFENNIKTFFRDRVPRLSIQSITIKEGYEHYIVEVNNALIFRFAKSEEAKKHLAIEVNLLKFLESKITYSIPQIKYYFPNEFCFGYHKIKGNSFSSEYYKQMDNSQKMQYAKDLAHFLCELHKALSIENARKIGLTDADWPLKPEELNIRLSILKNEQLEQIFNKFIKAYQQLIQSSSPVMLVHNDLHPDNILITTETKRLSGIIDFTSAAIDNAYHDFRYLHLIDLELVALSIQEYNKISQEQLIIRNAYLYCMATEFSRLSEALEKNDLTKIIEIKNRIDNLSILVF